MSGFKFSSAFSGLFAAIVLCGSSLAGDNCGCETSCAPCKTRTIWSHGCCRRHCYYSAESMPPQGMVVESVPMARISPLLFATPTMMATEAAFFRPLAVRQESAEEAAEDTCKASSSKLRQLESRLDSLDNDFDDLKDIVKANTRILEKLDARLSQP